MRLYVIPALAIPAAVAAALALAGAARAPGSAAQSGPPPTAYVVNSGSNTVTPINTVTNRAGRPVKVGTGPNGILLAPDGKTAYIPGSTGVTPVSTVTRKAGKLIAIKGGVVTMAVTPNGKTLYVAGYGSTVTPVNTATGNAGKPITWQPGGNGVTVPLLVTPNGKTLYAASVLGTVTPISTATGKAGKPIKFGPRYDYGGVYMAVTPNGKTLYAFGSGPCRPADTVTPISTATNTAGKAINVVQYPDAIVVSPNGKTVYVGSTGYPAGHPGCPTVPGSKMSIIRSPQYGISPAQGSGQGAVTPISTATNRPAKAITLGTEYAQTFVMAITPNGRTIYVTVAWNETGFADEVISVNTATGKTAKPIPLSGPAPGVVITPNGKTAYAVNPNASGTVIVIRTATNTVLKTIRVGKWPVAIAITP